MKRRSRQCGDQRLSRQAARGAAVSMLSSSEEEGEQGGLHSVLAALSAAAPVLCGESRRGVGSWVTRGSAGWQRQGQLLQCCQAMEKNRSKECSTGGSAAPSVLWYRLLQEEFVV